MIKDLTLETMPETYLGNPGVFEWVMEDDDIIGLEFVQFNDDGEEISREEIADDMALRNADMYETALRKYENGRTLFMADRAVSNVNGESDRAIVSRMDMVPVPDDIREAYVELRNQFVSDILTLALGEKDEETGEISEHSAGVLHLLWSDMMKDGRVYKAVKDAATNVASTLTLVGTVPTMDQLTKSRDKVRGLWTSLFASVDIEVIRDVLQVPCKITEKGRKTEGSEPTWVPAMTEIPKISSTSDTTEIAVVSMDGKEIFRTDPNNKNRTFSHALQDLGMVFSEFQVQAQLTPNGDQLWNLDVNFKGHHFTGQRITV